MEFDWLLARQSKYVIRILSFMHNPTSRTQQDLKIDIAESEEAAEGVFEISVQETSKPGSFSKRQTHRSKTGARSCH